MIIKDTQLHRDNGTTTLSARCKLRKIGWDTVYFSVGNTLPGDYIHPDASPFAAALLLPSMKQGENLVIEGSISAQLYRGMDAIMQEVLKWDIGLQPIKIEADALVADPPNGLALGDLPGVEQVELDFPDDVGDAGLVGLASGEVAGFLGFPGASPVGAVADEESGHEDFQQERGDGEFWLVRGKKPRRIQSRRLGRAGS